MSFSISESMSVTHLSNWYVYCKISPLKYFKVHHLHAGDVLCSLILVFAAQESLQLSTDLFFVVVVVVVKLNSVTILKG